ncbi:unnamed protein product [Chrysoparadoxa australica]
MDVRQKRNTKTYILELIITTPIFFAMTIKAPYILTVTPQESITPQGGGYAMAYSASWLVLLYTFELLYRNATNIWLVMHHMATITTVCLALVCLLDTYTEDVTLLLILAYSAVTEQSTFLALVLHRFGFKSAGSAFKVAAITSYLFKGAVFCITWFTYAKVVLPGVCNVDLSANAPAWNTFWRIWVPLVNVTLLATQVQANNVLWKLGNRMQNKHKERVAANAAGISSAPSSPPPGESADVASQATAAVAADLLKATSSPLPQATTRPALPRQSSSVARFIRQEASSFRSGLVRSRTSSCHFDIDMDDDGVVQGSTGSARQASSFFARGGAAPSLASVQEAPNGDSGSAPVV